jgi:hypothetical protein
MTLRVRAEESKLPDFLKELMDYVHKQGAYIIGLPISATYFIDLDSRIIEVEFYIRTDRKLPSFESFVYKPMLRLENCLKVNYKGNSHSLQHAIDTLNEHIAKNGLLPISVGFNVNLNEGTDFDPGLYEVDIYISINPNVV